MIFRKRIALIARCMLAGSLVGCAAEIATDDLADGEGEHELATEGNDDVRVLPQPLSTTIRRYLPTRGSFASPLVDSGSLGFGMLYRLTLRTGSLVDRVTAAFYFPSQRDNKYRPGDQLVQRTIGGTAGGAQPSQNCDAGFAAVGLRGRAGQRLDALGLVCASILANGESNLNDLQYPPMQGGSGGTAFTDLCGPAEWLGRVNVWVARKQSGTNDIISAIQGICYAAN